MKKGLAKRDGARRYKIYRGPSTMDAMLDALRQQIVYLAAEMGEDRDRDFQFVESGPYGKTRLATMRKPKTPKRQTGVSAAAKNG